MDKSPEEILEVDNDEEGGTTVSSQDDFPDDFSLPSSVTGSELGQAKKLKWKKLLHTVSKLRQENALLKDGVETARVNDVTLLEDRYRGAQADLSTVRKRNNDLKDRVQKLEGDLFEALAENRKMKGSSATGQQIPSSSTSTILVDSSSTTSPVIFDSMCLTISSSTGVFCAGSTTSLS